MTLTRFQGPDLLFVTGILVWLGFLLLLPTVEYWTRLKTRVRDFLAEFPWTEDS